MGTTTKWIIVFCVAFGLISTRYREKNGNGHTQRAKVRETYTNRNSFSIFKFPFYWCNEQRGKTYRQHKNRNFWALPTLTIGMRVCVSWHSTLQICLVIENDKFQVAQAFVQMAYARANAMHNAGTPSVTNMQTNIEKTCGSGESKEKPISFIALFQQELIAFLSILWKTQSTDIFAISKTPGSHVFIHWTRFRLILFSIWIYELGSHSTLSTT